MTRNFLRLEPTAAIMKAQQNSNNSSYSANRQWRLLNGGPNSGGSSSGGSGSTRQRHVKRRQLYWLYRRWHVPLGFQRFLKYRYWSFLRNACDMYYSTLPFRPEQKHQFKTRHECRYRTSLGGCGAHLRARRNPSKRQRYGSPLNISGQCRHAKPVILVSNLGGLSRLAKGWLGGNSTFIEFASYNSAILLAIKLYEVYSLQHIAKAGSP